MTWQPGCDPDMLAARAGLLSTIRAFFSLRNVLEVDTPSIARYGVTDPAIEPLVVAPDARQAHHATPRFLQTSPEFAMKRLLSAGSGPIYQLGKAFRAGEHGSRHNPEFTLLEWYRPGYTLDDLMEEVSALVRACLGERTPVSETRLTYSEAVAAATGLDPNRAGLAELQAAAAAHSDTAGLDLDRDAWLDLLMTHAVEPGLRGCGLVFIHAYPPSQAALARCTERGGESVAERFELYLDGIELANGYRELLDPQVLTGRADSDNRKRRAAALEERTLDPRLVAAMEAGLPDCSGVALGVDRLLMAITGAASLDEVMPFSWDRA
jgi:lysyl-tRNA synthetase class 2